MQSKPYLSIRALIILVSGCLDTDPDEALPAPQVARVEPSVPNPAGYYTTVSDQTELIQEATGFPVLYRGFAECEEGDTATGGGCKAFDGNGVSGRFTLVTFGVNTFHIQSFGCQYRNPDKREIRVVASAVCFDADGSRQAGAEDDE